jgi:hypothetical protein
MEIDQQTMRLIIDILKDMDTMMASLEDYTREDFINVIEDGADLYADYFRNNN